MLRLALVGLDSSHADHYVRLVAAERRWPGVRLVALVDGEPGRRAELAAAGGLLLDAGDATVPDVVGRVDAAIVAHRAGRRHGVATRALLAAGVPVLVDKPFAASVADARATLDVAHALGTAVTTASALRFAPEVAAARTALATVAEDPVAPLVAAAPASPPGPAASPPRPAVEVSGPADPHDERDGLFFLGIHVVEAARAVVGAPPGAAWSPPVVTRSADGIVATTRLGGVDVRLLLLDPGTHPTAGFAVAVRTPRGVERSEIVLDADYLAPVVEHGLAVLAPVTTTTTPTAARTTAYPADDAGRIADEHATILADLALLEQVGAALRP
ncbi:Oxidoreductase family, NAD-binding Rossmann fold [Cellulosimicrobium aquatile]|uniref:Oxidoreductase family, NAD-binding Rossmann fold n=1 Tax=Cellulosimicrobium aquatile TaxID=1612203 RepID=A0A1N6R9T5_9MICO|nr:Gfo/Idh/MocA family oxidoreductase [Cellulosimicrobium aquatile]SIQ25593.1 Oxidoreductase family, NAD-binding Rossmann fold [Cellulosimicrobium aquatile]